MAIASESTSEPTTAGGETDLPQRLQEILQEIENIDDTSPEGASRLAVIARGEADSASRRAAIARIWDLSILGELRSTPEISSAAGDQLLGILSGTIASPLEDSERIAYMQQLDPDSLLQVGVLTRHKPTAEAAVSRLELPDQLFELAQRGKSVHTRKAAAMAIEDSALLQQLLDKLQGKEKTVSAAIARKLESMGAESAVEPVVEKDSKTQPESSKVASATAADKAGDTLQARLQGLQEELGKLGTKNTAQLTALKRKLGQLKNTVQDAASETVNFLGSVEQQLQEKLRLNSHYQEQLRANTEELVKKLELALEEGRSDDALPAWDKIQGNISNTGGKIRAGLKKLANVHKGTLTELRDWKIFASTEKKKSLIDQMQQLIESKMHAADRSRKISAMHAEWKALGRSSQNEELWLEFKKFSDEAYKPCKEYFSQRKALMAENLKQRRAICERVEQALAELDSDNPVINELGKLIGEADKDWKKYAPVEQSKIKNLQKRYYGTLNKLRKIRKAAQNRNSESKKQCIARAEVLSELEDQKQAMEEAKKLQQQWKTIGPSTFKEDKQLWDKFRAACDKLFEARNKENAAVRDELKKVEDELKSILDKLMDIAKKGEEALRDSRGEYRELTSRFASAFDPRLRKQGKSLQERFNKIRRDIDARIKRLPDKKQLQIMQQLDAATALLETWEQPLLASKDVEQFNKCLTELDKSGWNDLELPADAELREELQQRFDALNGGGSMEGYLGQATAAENRLRDLCIETEIRADIESPPQDQERRMEMQLQQLQQGFGKARQGKQASAKPGNNAELRARAIGPMVEASRSPYLTRLNKAARKLL